MKEKNRQISKQHNDICSERFEIVKLIPINEGRREGVQMFNKHIKILFFRTR